MLAIDIVRSAARVGNDIRAALYALADKVDTIVSGGGGTPLTVGSVTNTDTITPGVGLLVSGSAGSATIDTTAPVETAKTAGFTIGAADMGRTIPVNISGGGTITISATGFGTTVFAAGQ